MYFLYCNFIVRRNDNVTSLFWHSFYSLVIWANSFMSAILTFILFFVYFPVRGRKPTWSALVGDKRRSGLTKNLLLRPFRPSSIDRHCDGESYEWHMFWNITCSELPLEKKFRRTRSLFVVKYAGVLWEWESFAIPWIE